MASPFLDSVAEQAPAAQADLPGAQLGWLEKARRQQLQAFLDEGLPGSRNESWKYTSLRAFARRTYRTGDADAASRPVDRASLDLPGVDGPRLVFVHGVFRPDLSDLDDCPDGLHVQPVSQALTEGDETLRPALSRDWQGPADAFARLNTALAGDGLLLRVADGARIEPTLHLLHVGMPADNDFAWHVRNSITLGEGATLDLVEHHVGSAAHKHLGTLVSDVTLGRDSHLGWTTLQDAADGAQLMRRDYLRLEAGAAARVHALELGGGLVRHELDADLLGDGARIETRGVFMPRGRQHFDTRLDIRHKAVNTQSDSLWRGVADQRGRGVFHGAIVVEQGADGADASLNNKNLLLSAHAEIDTQPVLEIYADEVLAAHGATVGQLDQSALFYLRSRGLPADQARSLLTAAFCQAALDSLPNADLRQHISTQLAQRLPGQAG